MMADYAFCRPELQNLRAFRSFYEKPTVYRANIDGPTLASADRMTADEPKHRTKTFAVEIKLARKLPND